MKKIVIIDLDKWEKMPYKLSKLLLESFKKGYGYKLISREDGHEIDFNNEDGHNEFIGFMCAILESKLKEYFGD